MDIIIKNGLVVDGTGAQAKRADVAVRNGRIAAVGERLTERADRYIEADDLVVAPGFIDILNHADAYLTLLKNPASESLLAQGVTTALIGNCGASLAPITHGKLIAVVQKWGEVRDINVDWERFGELLEMITRLKPGINIAGLVGHTTLRRTVLEDDPRAATKKELDTMVALLKGALHDGAFGLSFAPSYAHARVAPPEEIDALTHALYEEGGRYFAVHLRDEGDAILESVNEAIAIAKRASLSLEISHLKPVGEQAQQAFPEVLKAIEEAHAAETPVHFDVFPWRTSLTVLYLLFPQWAQEGGFVAMRKRFKTQETRDKVIAELKKKKINWHHYVVAEAKRNTHPVGKSIAEIAKHAGITPEETAVNLFITHEGRVLLFRKGEDLAPLIQAVNHPQSFIATAGGGYREEDEALGWRVHPRSFGTMAKFVNRFVVDRKDFSLEEAVAKLTGAVAKKLGITDRGIITKGGAADLVVFHPTEFRNHASFRSPFRYPEGMHWVIVNGDVAVNPDGITGVRSGVTLRNAATYRRT